MLSIRNVFVNSIGTLFSRILGLFKNIIINFYFGLVDTFWGAFQIINTFRIFVGEGAINNVLIPNYKKVKEEKPEYLKFFVLKSFLFVSLISVILILILVSSSYYISKIALPGFSEDKIIESSWHINIMSSVVILISLQSFIATIQIAKRDNFIGFAYSPVVANIITILTIVLFHNTGVFVISWSVVAGAVGMLIFQTIFSLRDIGSVKIHLSLREIVRIDEYTKKFVLGFFSVIGLSLITQLNGIVSRFFGSFFEGVVAASTNAYIIIQVPIGIFSVAVSVVGLNALASYFSKKDTEGFLKLSSESIRLINFVIIPITIFSFIFSDEIIRLAYRDIPGIILGSEGKYNEQALKLTQDMFKSYSLSIYFLSISLLLVRISFSRGDTRTPVLSSIVGLIVNILANVFIFLIFRSPLGIPLSFLISSAVLAIYLTVVEYKNIGYKKVVLYEAIKLLIPSLVISLTIKYILNTFDVDSYILSFAITSVSIIVFVLLFLLTSYVIRIETFTNILKKVVR